MAYIKSLGYAYLLVSKTGEDILIQSDWELPAFAACMGYAPCKCGMTDGTVDCEHKTAREMILEAGEWIDDNLGEEFDELEIYFEGE